MKVLVVGCGRMGLRHLRGLAPVTRDVHVADPRPEARAAAEAAGVESFLSLEDALAAGTYDAAVLAETATGRLERLQALAAAGVRSLLLEKPVEQSRERLSAAAHLVREQGMDARVNHFFRTLDLFRELREAGGPHHVAVTGGAFGLACNGIHWIDLALYLSGDAEGWLLYGELDETPIASGRGAEFRDYGGRALFGFADGTRLHIASAAGSSAPIHAVVTGSMRQTVLFPHDETAVVYERDPASRLPAYRYGAEYGRRELPALGGDELWCSTERWARAVAAGDPPGHPELELSARAHELLFDLLETSGERAFPIT